MALPHHPISQPLVWLVAAGFGLLACRMDNSRSSGVIEPTISLTSTSNRESADEQSIRFSVPEMDNILAARRATQALESLPSVLEARASTIDQAIEVVTDGPAPLEALISALSKAGLYAIPQ